MRVKRSHVIDNLLNDSPVLILAESSEQRGELAGVFLNSVLFFLIPDNPVE